MWVKRRKKNTRGKSNYAIVGIKLKKREGASPTVLYNLNQKLKEKKPTRGSRSSPFIKLGERKWNNEKKGVGLLVQLFYQIWVKVEKNDKG